MGKIQIVLLASVLVIVSGLVLPCDSRTLGGIQLVNGAFAQTAGNSSGDLSSVLPDNSTDFGIPGDNSTTSTQGQTPSTVPEFGGVAPIILVIAIASIIVLSAKKMP